MKFLSDLLDLLLPQTCAGCGRPSALLCATCLAFLTGAPARYVRPNAELSRCWAVASYQGPVRAVIVAHKEHGRTPLAAPLGTALAKAIKTAVPSDEQCAVVWIPSSHRSIRARGHDPTRRMAAAAVDELRRAGTPVTALQALRHRREVADQASLSAVQRAANLAGALEPSPNVPLSGRRVVLVDDVITTGATLTEGARALRTAGARILAAATVAATPTHQEKTKPPTRHPP
ncbi:hypothetical protein GCM10010191_40310 [Actinomadura vinacea]|uniref:Phosphoribosyltransferase domain-containing protein n=1 Tax=Actinomadura vinacea TaxID=115336 RepID=A0ABP5WE61_9ACTN